MVLDLVLSWEFCGSSRLFVGMNKFAPDIDSLSLLYVVSSEIIMRQFKLFAIYFLSLFRRILCLIATSASATDGVQLCRLVGDATDNPCLL